MLPGVSHSDVVVVVCQWDCVLVIVCFVWSADLRCVFDFLSWLRHGLMCFLVGGRLMLLAVLLLFLCDVGFVGFYFGWML